MWMSTRGQYRRKRWLHSVQCSRKMASSPQQTRLAFAMGLGGKYERLEIVIFTTGQHSQVHTIEAMIPPAYHCDQERR